MMEDNIRKRLEHTPAEKPETDETAPKKAVALKYDPGTNVAPQIVAKGQGYVAENILNLAQQNALPVYQNKTLVNMLMALDIDKEIPPELYTTVAEVLAYVYRIDSKAGKNKKRDFGNL